jgi:hypothetical protein
MSEIRFLPLRTWPNFGDDWQNAHTWPQGTTWQTMQSTLRPIVFLCTASFHNSRSDAVTTNVSSVPSNSILCLNLAYRFFRCSFPLYRDPLCTLHRGVKVGM